ncbi:hypothetical protein PQX77_010556 [Marasmius sp. AFHP31]|nr:hypothetical protein PQX77_010556 [Marasmius sp. AFHP31]
MSFSEATSIDLELEGVLGDYDLDSFTEYLGSLFTNASIDHCPRRIAYLRFEQVYTSGVATSAWNTTDKSNVSHDKPRPHCQCRMLKQTRRGSLEILDISLSPLPQDVVVHQVGKCPPLHTIIVDQRCASGVIDPYRVTYPREVEAKDGEQEIQLVNLPMVYPALTTTHVSRADFSGNLLDLFIDSLQLRLEPGLPIKDVSLKECKYVFEDAVLRLKANVDASVDWDSYTSGYEDVTQQSWTAPPDDYIETLDEFDEQIKKVEGQLAQLKSRRNLRVPICRLPVEILGRILTFSGTDTYPTSRPKYPSAMSVCRLWRAVAMDTPTMWSKPNFYWPKWVRETMKYSKSIPLDVQWTSYSVPEQRQLDVLFEVVEECSRVASLDFVSRSAPDLTTLLSKMVSPAPHIHFTRLETVYESDFFMIPVNFLGEDAPRLTHFQIKGCNVPWGSPILRNLTTLSIGRANFNGTGSSLEDVSATLQAAPMLETVDLSDFLPSTASISLPRDTKIDLPRLKRLHLSSRGMVVATLLHHMSFPTSTSIHMTVRQIDDSQDSLAEYLSSLFPNVSTTTHHSRTVRTLVLDNSRGYGLVIRAWDTDTDTNNPLHYDVTPQLHCEMGRDGWSASALLLLKRLLPALGSLANLQRLEVGLPGLSPDIMIPHFGKCPLLHTISISDTGSALDVVRSWSHNLSLNAPRKGKGRQAKSSKKNRRRPAVDAVVFPALETVGMLGIYFNDLMDPLVKSLELRSKCGFPVKKVILESCRHLYEDDIARLEEEFEGEVVWDGSESDSEDEYEGEYSDLEDDPDLEDDYFYMDEDDGWPYY